jgi:hypothetical protein
MSHWNQTQFSELFNLSGISTAPGQVWQSIRLVPLLRENAITDLKLHREVTEADLGIVNLEDDLAYISYIPHSMILSWNPESLPEAAIGTQMSRQRSGHKQKGRKHWKHAPVVQFERMAQKRNQRQLRFLPQHLGIESYLHQFFNAPTIDWRDTYSRSAISQGLNPRSTWMMNGWAIESFKDALRLFEYYPQQIGLMLFVGDALAAIQICPTPQDYKSLHSSLLEDVFGEIFWYYSRFPVKVPELKPQVHSQAQNWHELRIELKQLRGEICAFQTWMAAGLLEAPIRSQEVQGIGPYRLNRFISELDPQDKHEAHLGEFIADAQGQLVYLKTCRLSQAQIEQAWLLEQLNSQLWHLENTAKALNLNQDQLLRKMLKLDLGRLLKPQVIDQMRKREREL